MATSKRYCLDANALIEPWNKYFTIVRCPEYWDILEDLGKKQTVFCPDQVKREIGKIDDGLKAWLNSRDFFFRQETEIVQQHVRTVLKEFPQLINVGASRSMADPWVIAHAMAEHAVVVSKEYLFRPGQKSSQIKIPDVCKHFNVTCINDFDFVDELGIKFKASI